MQRARHLALPFALATRLRQSRAAKSEKPSKRSSGLGERRREMGDERTRASNDSSCVGVCARARTHPENLLLNDT